MLSPVPVNHVMVVHDGLAFVSLLFLVVLRPCNRPVQRKGYDGSGRDDYLARAVVAEYGMATRISDYLTSQLFPETQHNYASHCAMGTVVRVPFWNTRTPSASCVMEMWRTPLASMEAVIPENSEEDNW